MIDITLNNKAIIFALMILNLSICIQPATVNAAGRDNLGDILSNRSADIPSVGKGREVIGRQLETQSGLDTNSSTTDPDTALAQMAKKYETAIGLVIAVVPVDGKFQPVPFGTAWAVRPNVFATNSHVTEPIKKLLAHGVEVFIALNKSPKNRIKVNGAISHPRFQEKNRNFQGLKSVGLSFDVGLLTTEESVLNFFPTASNNELKKVDSGYRIAYLGFPMEGLENNNVNIYSPVATMQSGIVTSISDYWQGDSGFEKNFLIRHNLGATGGASGSPLFNTKGEVIGVLNAGNVVWLVQFDMKKKPVVKRSPNAAMINFGQRIDLLNDLLN